MNLSKVKICPVLNGKCWSNEAVFKIKAESGWYLIDIFKRRIIRKAVLMDLRNARSRLMAYHFEGQFVSVNFDIENKLKPIKDVSLLSDLRNFEVARFQFIRDRWFYFRKESVPHRVLTTTQQIENTGKFDIVRGTTPEELYMYGAYSVYILNKQAKIKAESLPERIKESLRIGGAELIEWKPVSDGMIDVTWKFREQLFISTIQERTLNVFNAGVCLAGSDRKQTLSSLPYVVKYAIDKDELYITRHV